MTIHCMIDFETLSTMPNAAVLSLGAVAFTSDGLSDQREFYVNINADDCASRGLHISESTVQWWEKQSDEAKEALRAEPIMRLYDAISSFNAWVAEVKAETLWGNGADFDNPILKSCFGVFELDPPFKPWAGRCYRTIKSIPGMPKINRSLGVHHNALDDARNQALHLIEMNRIMRVLE